MTLTFALILLLSLAAAALLLWRVVHDFFAALEAEYDRQLSRDPEYKKRRRMRRKPLREKVKRLLRRAAFHVKRPLYLLAVSLGVKR